MKGFDYAKALDHLSKDKKLAPYLQSITLRDRQPSTDVYAGLISSITGQQLSIKAAATIHGRFLDLFSDRYPNPETLLTLTDEQLRAAGLSGQKSKYVRNVATFFMERDLFDTDWSDYTDDEIVKLLTVINGVGKWTVQMILMFVLLRTDVLPVLDLGIQQGMAKIYNLKEEKKALHTRMEKIAEKWRPFRTIACLYLWQVEKK